MVVVLPSTMAHLARRQLVEFMAEHRLPAIYFDRAFAEAGGLMSYGPNWLALFHRAAAYADRILKGTKPADLPVEEPTSFELVINLKTAQAQPSSQHPFLWCGVNSTVFGKHQLTSP
jgi:putative tryptophan/tyrosine transport system substrate-binding protein